MIKKRKSCLAILLAICMVITMLPTAALAASTEEIEGAHQMQDGETFDLSTISGTGERPIAIQNPGTYTFTGSNFSGSVRVFITADCTLHLDEMKLKNEAKWERDDTGKMVEYLGGTKGAIEIADGVTVNLVLSDDNQITCKKASGTRYGICYNGFLLGDQSKVIVSGSGRLDIGGSSIGTKLADLSDLNDQAAITIESGSLTCLGLGSNKLNRQDGKYLLTSKNIVLTYNGGSFYCYDDDTGDDLIYSPTVRTFYQATQDNYRIKIPATGDVYIRRGVEGAFSQTKAHNGYVYAWVDEEDFKANSPVRFSVLSDAGYHVYQAVYAANTFLCDATEVDESPAATVQGMVSDPMGFLSATDKLVFVDQNNAAIPAFTATINADTSYSITLPTGTYTAKLMKPKYTLDLDNIEVTEARAYQKDLTILAATVQGTVSDPNGLLSAGGKLTFTDKSGTLPDLKAAINANGSYSIVLPLRIYETKIEISRQTFTFDDIEVTEATTYEKDFTISASLPDVINVYTVEDLDIISLLAAKLNGKTINIMADIALPDDFKGIQLSDISVVTVNGNNHTLSNLRKPLFVADSLSGSVKDLKLKGNIDDYRAAAIASFATNISLENCSFEGELKGYYVGGFIGYVEGDGSAPVSPKVTIKNCLVDAKLSGNGAVGGLIGYESMLADATIENCGVHYRAIEYYDYSGVDYKNAYGGFMGKWDSDSNVTVKNSYLFVKEAKCNLSPICGISMSGVPNRGTINAYYNNSVIYQDDGVTSSINDKATPMDSALMKAAAGAEGALVDILNANVTPENGYRHWTVKDGELPTFEPAEEPSVAPTYTVTIPESVTLGSTVTVSASGVTVAEGYALNVSIGGEFALTDSSISEQYRSVPYSVYMGENATGTPLVSGDNVLSVADGTTDGSAGQVLYFSEPSELPKYSGNYTGTVTFTVSVDAINE